MKKDIIQYLLMCCFVIIVILVLYSLESIIDKICNAIFLTEEEIMVITLLGSFGFILGVICINLNKK